MNKNCWIRARNQDQVDERTGAILDAAEKVFIENRYENVTMLMIAHASGITRSNIYRYFKTKEEIFLRLYMNYIQKWFDDISAMLGEKMTPEKFSEIWTDVLIRQEHLLELSSYLSISLEKNSSEEIFRTTKMDFLEKINQGTSVIGSVLPELPGERIKDFLIFNQALLAGAWPMCRYSDIQEKVLSESELNSFKLSFREFYMNTVLIYLKGMSGA